MRRKGFFVSRAVGGVAAGVLMAGAGVGVAVAGASSSSDQYTPGAKPYNGVQPHNVTVGTQTFPSSVTTTISNTSTTVTQYEVVTTPYVSDATAETLVAELQNVVNALNAETAATAKLSAQFTAVLRGDMSNLLEPTGSYLKIKTLAKAKSVSLKFTSPGSGKLSVKWLVAAPGKTGVAYINYSGTLRKTGAIVVKLPSTAAGRKTLATIDRANAVATVTYTGTSGNSIKISRGYKLQG